MDLSNRLRNYILDTVPKDVIDYLPKEVFCLDVFDLLAIEDDSYAISLYNSNKLDTYELSFLLVSMINIRDKSKCVDIYSEVLEGSIPALSAIALECLYKLGTEKAKEVISYVASNFDDDTIREIAEYYSNN
jgi:hypothetical protein